MTQDDYRELYKKINKKWNDSVSIYKELVKKEINEHTVVMEAGVGFSDMYKEEYKRAKHVIGVDIDPEYLANNKVVREKIVADLSSIPQIKDESVDLIISSWVFEHLKTPEKVFAEFSRILKKGGKVIFIIPNSLNYVVLINKILPQWLRNKLARGLTANLTVDPMPTFYRANSYSKINKLAKQNNLRVDKLILNGDPTYVAVNKFFFYIGVILEAILSLPLLRRTKVHIIGVLQKN